MIKLAKYLKPFIFGLILAILLLFVQANCDLSLPNFMSDIVNTGIQNSGIKHAAPDAVSQNGLALIKVFMTEDEKELVDDAYFLASVSDKNKKDKTYGSLYPGAVDRLFIKNELDQDTAAELDQAFGTSTWALIYVVQSMPQDRPASEEMSAGIGSVDIKQVYQLLPMLQNLPQDQVTQARNKALQNDEMMLTQGGTMLAKLFYGELDADTGAIATSYILTVGLKMLAVALLGGVATVLVSFISSKIAAGTARNLRRDVFNKIERFSNNEFDKFSTASLITRCTNDITQIQMLLMMGIRMVSYAPIMAIGGTVMALRKSVSMSWIIAAACTLLIGIILVIMSIAMPKFKIIQKLVDRLNLVSRENLSGLMVIRAFGTRTHEENRFESANRNLTDTNLFVTRVMVFLMPAMMLIMNGVTLIIIWVGSHQIAASAMQVGDMMAFMQYATQIIFSFLMISMMFVFIPRAAVSAERIAEVLETPESIVDPENPKAFHRDKKGLVEFRNVCFRYEGADEDALNEITFTAKPGQTTAIIGPTGSGKSTIANLILRFYDASKGQVVVDGMDVREVKQKDLRAIIGYVPQKGVLLSGTIASNIRYGKQDASDNEVETAARVAQAIDFIKEKPDRFDSEIAQGGTNVSGGQKQRLSIARALAKNPEIFIFDDSFSALDYKTDIALRKALKEHTGDSTVIIIAQRVSTIINAQQIIVLEEGKIAGIGTHRELLKSCPEYYEIASSQLSQEELS
ncbi:MAG TPA: ABC transporter ATP-binding protein [Clostridia bacterium]|nr:ABC transporter ATP-binding protein [Clostridia bacterium]